jgi:hypothetical protein
MSDRNTFSGSTYNKNGSRPSPERYDDDDASDVALFDKLYKLFLTSNTGNGNAMDRTDVMTSTSPSVLLFEPGSRIYNIRSNNGATIVEEEVCSSQVMECTQLTMMTTREMTLLRHVIPHDEISSRMTPSSPWSPWEVEPFDVYTTQSDMVSNRHIETFADMATIGTTTTEDSSYVSNQTACSSSSTKHGLEHILLSTSTSDTSDLEWKVSTPLISLFNENYVTVEKQTLEFEADSIECENKKKNPKKRKALRCEEDRPLVPIRPLSAYNNFFRDEREHILLHGTDDSNNMIRHQRPVPMEFHSKERSKNVITRTLVSKS